jgi:hypothetical protein
MDLPAAVILSAAEIDTFSGRRNVGQRWCVYRRAIAVPATAKRFILSREQYRRHAAPYAIVDLLGGLP